VAWALKRWCRKKPAGVCHGNNVDVGDVIEIKDNLDDDHKLLRNAHIGVVRLLPLPPIT